MEGPRPKAAAAGIVWVPTPHIDISISSKIYSIIIGPGGVRLNVAQAGGNALRAKGAPFFLGPFGLMAGRYHIWQILFSMILVCWPPRITKATLVDLFRRAQFSFKNMFWNLWFSPGRAPNGKLKAHQIV